MRFLAQKRDTQSKLSKRSHVAEVTVEGPSIAPKEDCSSKEEILALGGAVPTPDLKNL